MRVGVGIFTGGPSGIPVSVMETAQALRRAGTDVVMFATSDAEVPVHSAGLIGQVVRLRPLPRGLRHPRVAHALHLPARLMLGRRLADALRAHPVDVVHAFSPGVAPPLPPKQAVVVQSWFHPPELWPRLRTVMPLSRRSPPLYLANAGAEIQAHIVDMLGYRRADLVLTNTERAVGALRTKGFAAWRIPPCIEVPCAPVQRDPAEALRVTFCAYNLDTPRKGLHLLLEALPLVSHRPLTLTLVGRWTDALAPGVAAVRAAGVDVYVLGLLPRERYLEQLARRTDLLVCTSLYEEWGYAVFEALSRGVPALAFDLYPFSETFDADTGLLVAPGRPEALAQGIDQAATGRLPPPEVVVRSTRQRFGAEAIANRLLEAYERTLGETRLRIDSPVV